MLIVVTLTEPISNYLIARNHVKDTLCPGLNRDGSSIENASSFPFSNIDGEFQTAKTYEIPIDEKYTTNWGPISKRKKGTSRAWCNTINTHLCGTLRNPPFALYILYIRIYDCNLVRYPSPIAGIGGVRGKRMERMLSKKVPLSWDRARWIRWSTLQRASTTNNLNCLTLSL